MWRYFETEQGLSLIELIVAVALLVGSLVGFSYFLARGRGMIGDLGSDRLAVEFAESRLEELSG